MKRTLATLALFMMIPIGESKWAEMVSDAENILRLLEDMAICQEVELPNVKLITYFANMHGKQVQPVHGKSVHGSIKRATKPPTIEKIKRFPCRRFNRWSC